MTTPPNEWEEEFDEMFQNVYEIDGNKVVNCVESIKFFIRKTLSAQHEKDMARVREMVEGMKRNQFTYKKNNEGWIGGDEAIGYNRALSDILITLNRLK